MNGSDAAAQSAPTAEVVGVKLEQENGQRNVQPEAEGVGAQGQLSSSDGDATSDEEEEEEEEPKLKYSRLTLSQDVLVKDRTSTFAVSEKLLAIGMQSGRVVLLDLQGNVIKSSQPHTAYVFSLSIDSSSQFVASASLDGKVVVTSAISEDTQVFDMQRPMRAVALDPNYGKHNTHQVITGGMAGLLIHHEKGWLGQKDVTIHAGEGPIWNISRRGHLVAWANDEAARVYDLKSSTMVGHLPRNPEGPRPDLFRCHFAWVNDRSFVIGWADQIKLVHIKERQRSRTVPGVGSSIELYAEVTAIFEVDCMIAGLALFREDYLILAYTTTGDDDDEEDEEVEGHQKEEGSPKRPELRLISKQGEELSADALSIPNFEHYQCHDYHLASLPSPPPAASPAHSADPSVFYVVSPKDFVVARPRDAADHVLWLVEHEKFDEALRNVEAAGLSQEKGFDVLGVGLKYLYHLLDKQQFQRAAEAAPAILGQRQREWEDWAWAFIQRDQIDALYPVLPTHHPQLSSLVYEMVLAHLVKCDADLLLQTIRSWPQQLYSAASVIAAVQGALENNPDSEALLNSIADLYLGQQQPGKAITFLLKLRRPGVVELVQRNNLFTDIQDKIADLIAYDRHLEKRQGKQVERQSDKPDGPQTVEDGTHGAAIQLLVDNTHSVPIPRVVAQLKTHRRFLWMYLDALFDKDPDLGQDYADLQAELYADFEPSKLLGFLRISSSYNLETIYQVCKAKDFVHEMVFLLGRMGNNRQALTLLIEKIGDVHQAIDFAKGQEDPELWDDLLNYSASRPLFIKGLLENAGTEINPVALIKRIRDGLEIPGLRDALVKILQDTNLQITLMEGCQDILQSDCRNLSDRLMDGQRRAFLGNAKSVCAGCEKPVFTPDADSTSSSKSVALLFLCRHVFHAGCAFPSAEANLPSRSARAVEARSLDLQECWDSNGSSYMQSALERQFRAQMRFTAELRSTLKAVCPLCSES